MVLVWPQPQIYFYWRYFFSAAFHRHHIAYHNVLNHVSHIQLIYSQYPLLPDRPSRSKPLLKCPFLRLTTARRTYLFRHIWELPAGLSSGGPLVSWFGDFESRQNVNRRDIHPWDLPPRDQQQKPLIYIESSSSTPCAATGAWPPGDPQAGAHHRAVVAKQK